MTLFEQLIARKLPCHVVYEDALVFAFLDIAPRAPGHTLLVPKEAAATLAALSEESAAGLGRVLPRLCRALVSVTGVTDYNVLQNNGENAGQVVPHVHFHLVPKPSSQLGLQILSPATSSAQNGDAAAMAAAIAAAMR